ncbi:PREDICTED: SURP and G-patch domain-containing protein 1-like isoform X2 [Priapulus caudatus]|uniref:SURP and G-patch domain-containing protein 1-like isoform X2 n=1 Tax=Priapulus caudatus TaxID=37621 RepID=A0ABM1E2A5_PRICU|nr:PREDICTED: SURP and G-patch domain-containing protein 1-like isoform X2 [Priapulus caudatus]
MSQRGVPAGPRTSLGDKMRQMTEQQRLIEQRKQEIERKLEQSPAQHPNKQPIVTGKMFGAKRQKVSAMPQDLPLAGIHIPPPPPIQGPAEPAAQSKVVPFQNDGSFLETFKKMYGGAKEEACPAAPVSSKTIPLGPRESQTEFLTSQQRSGEVKLTDVFDLEDESSDVAADGRSAKRKEDGELRGIIDKLAEFVAEGGAEVEEAAVKSNRDNPAFWFLYEENSRAHKYYRQKVEELKEEKGLKKKRRSRWGESEGNSDLAPPGVASISALGAEAAAAAAAAAAVVPPPPAHPWSVGARGFSIPAHVNMVGSSELSDAQRRQIWEQQQMSKLFEQMKARKKALEDAARQGKPRYEYDSDEEVDGGTWEHKRRMVEMEATKEYNTWITDMNRGRHHIGDFLPPDELKKFMEKFTAIQEGRDPDLSDYKEHKLTDTNVGYQMLQKMGWEVGKGLGSEGKGIVDPINKGQQPVENMGLGHNRPDNLAQGDDEFEAYRKRMMLSYRFRPNPLNNPRRPYY